MSLSEKLGLLGRKVGMMRIFTCLLYTSRCV